MTDEKRKELIAALRRKADTGAARVPICGEAADELERQPVAWQYRNEISKAIALGISDNKHPISIADDVLALLANPPRPDVSAEPRVTLDEIEAAMDRVLERRGFQTTRPDASAGLREAAEIAETIANSDEVEPWVERAVLRSFAKFLRAPAANRS